MAKLPIISGEKLIDGLKKSGKTVVPLHKELARGTLLGILKQCGLSKEHLLELLK